MTKDNSFFNKVSNDRISARQMDEMIGLARGLCADGTLNQSEVEFLQGWLAASLSVSDQPLLQTLWVRVNAVLKDGVMDQDEHADLFETLQNLGGSEIELGEALKSTTLPLCSPAPSVTFEGQQFVFTGTFSYGQRKDCERAVLERNGEIGSLTRKTDYLVIGSYATDSWKHSSMGAKILRACELRQGGAPISIVSEAHWCQFL
ncbi:BRCT domain-containing protein [Novosphingobium sp.]|uniref:BRCT domain-containing protein n=1 Tax=Novosphingobium sp. TaxID=1874826 RepID=UPI0027355ECF|nr:BRCT domain-containing protein [Novosphingobium sp.]MDP3908013.1 BRCT domain-containing protein [Novosphingobium sp.]